VGHNLAGVDDSFPLFGVIYTYHIDFNLVTLLLRALIVHHQLTPFYKSKVRANEKFTGFRLFGHTLDAYGFLKNTGMISE
jgi:hypothetical protein